MTSYKPEKAVLYLIALGDDLAYKFSVTKEHYFQSDISRSVFRRLKAEYENTGKIDMIIAHRILDEGIDYLKFDGESPLEAHFDIYLEKTKKDTMYIQFYRIVEATKKQDISLEEGLEKTRQIIKEYSTEKTNHYFTMTDLALDVVEKVKNLREEQIITSGFGTLDKALQGFKPGDIYILAARTAVGKTSLAVQLSLNIADQGKKVLFYSSEMTGINIMQRRIFPIVSGIDAYKFSNEKLFYQELDNFVKTHIETITRKDIIVCDESRPNLEHIRLGIEQHKPNLVILDHLHRCSFPHSDSYRLAIREFMVGLTEIAKEHKISILLASQISREAEKDKGAPTLADLSESKAIEEEATAVLLLWIDPKRQSENNRIISANLAKNRNGYLTRFEIYFDRKNLRLSEVDNGAISF